MHTVAGRYKSRENMRPIAEADDNINIPSRRAFPREPVLAACPNQLGVLSVGYRR